MSRVLRISLAWVDSRTGFHRSIRSFLLEDIPASAGWPQVFGSVALFLFFTQVLTGILLALNYAPTPSDAYASLTYIVRHVAAGKIVRGLHHWGASLMIVVVVLHMIQVFLYGAYKKPREATWLAGVVLFLMTLAFGLTGYLLPWDNRAYWGTMVTTRLMAGVPFLGGYLLELAGARNGIGVVSFSRFYTLHTVILPAAAIGTVALHVFLVRRHGVCPTPTASYGTKKFYPSQAYRDVCAIFVAFTVLFLVAAFVDAPLESIANPTDTKYVPRPEWYFLFLFQALKYFHGILEPVGAIGLPAAAVIALFAVPFIDRGRALRLSERSVAIGVIILAGVGWAALTAEAVASTPKTQSVHAAVGANEWARLPAEEVAGVAYFRAEGCASCHNLGFGEPKPGPNLGADQPHQTRRWLLQHFRAVGEAGVQTDPHAANALSTLAADVTPQMAALLKDAPSEPVSGAQIYFTHGCGGCHKVNHTGGDIGPPLNGVLQRHPKNWIIDHFANPAKLSPGSVMPPYQFSTSQVTALVSYLSALPDE